MRIVMDSAGASGSAGKRPRNVVHTEDQQSVVSALSVLLGGLNSVGALWGPPTSSSAPGGHGASSAPGGHGAERRAPPRSRMHDLPAADKVLSKIADIKDGVSENSRGIVLVVW